jgi:hypothetical protein
MPRPGFDACTSSGDFLAASVCSCATGSMRFSRSNGGSSTEAPLLSACRMPSKTRTSASPSCPSFFLRPASMSYPMSFRLTRRHALPVSTVDAVGVATRNARPRLYRATHGRTGAPRRDSQLLGSGLRTSIGVDSGKDRDQATCRQQPEDEIRLQWREARPAR